MSKAHQITTATRMLLWARAYSVAGGGAVCEVCGRQPAAQIHHRRPRGMGGSRRTSTNKPSNLIVCCLDCHHDIEEGTRTKAGRASARRMGWLLHQHVKEPRDEPAWLATDHGRHLVWLHDDGTKSLVDLVTDIARGMNP